MPPQGQLQDHTIASRALKKSMRLHVYLPPRYDDFNMRYPVVILLHPWGEDETFWTARLQLNDLADHLINAGSIPPFIAAMPQGDKSYFIDAADPPDDFSALVRLDPEYYEGALQGYGKYGEHVLHDVLNTVEKKFRTRGDRFGLAIGGAAMGAAGAAVLAFRNPDRFGAVGIHSPTLFDEWRSGPPWIFGLGDKAALAKSDPVQLVRALPAASGLRIYVDCGTEDEMSGPASNLHWALVGCGTPHTYVSRPGEGSMEYWRAHLAEYLGFYAGAW